MEGAFQFQPDYQTATVQLPTFHAAQAKLRWVMSKARFVAARCGRRFGKNVLGEGVAVDDAAHGRLVGWFAPENKRLSESYRAIRQALEPIVKSSDKTHGMIRTITGGAVEFWSLEDENAGRSRKYHRIIGDEVAFTKPETINWWKKAARPTLVDYRGRALMMSNTAGIDPENFLYEICHDPKHGFVQFHAPSRSNPHLPRDEVASFEIDNEPLVYQQEYLAEFVDWSGAAFFALDKMLENGSPVEWPSHCEAVFATIDTAVKTGSENDGTGAVFWALIRNLVRPVSPSGLIGPPYRLVILDWDVEQIEGALLEVWLPGVYAQLTDMAIKCGAARGSLGAFIEDKSSGTILIQQARNQGLLAFPIESKLTQMGKDERAISVSKYFYQGMVKMSRQAFTKVKSYKGKSLNHLRSQVVGFKIGDKNARKRQDDLLDCFDEETEILTDVGWKHFADLDRTELVATINLPADIIEYQKPTAYIDRNYIGEMIGIKGKRIDILVTPNHRMIIENNNVIWRGEYRPQMKLAKDLRASGILKNTSRWIGTQVPVLIPAWIYENTKSQPLWGHAIDRKLMAAFIGWFLAEGYRSIHTLRGSCRRRVSIAQMPGKKAQEIEEILTALPFAHHVVKGAAGCLHFIITSAQLYKFLDDCYLPGEGRGCYRKKIPQWILDSSPEILEAFFDAVVKGDGWEQEGHRTVATTSSVFADQLQECLIKMGKASTLKVRDNLPPIKIRGFSSNKSATQYHVNEIRSKYVFLVNRRLKTSIISHHQYDGHIYCVSAPNGTLILRRNGKTFLAGNCATYGAAIALGNAEGF